VGILLHWQCGHDVMEKSSHWDENEIFFNEIVLT
jgi:hypothetical protein